MCLCFHDFHDIYLNINIFFMFLYISCKPLREVIVGGADDGLYDQELNQQPSALPVLANL